MFKNQPKIYAHKSALNNGNFVVGEAIILKNNNKYNLKSRECPHRGYIMHAPGDVIKDVVCKLHGFAWDNEGRPLSKEPYCNHFYKLASRGDLEISKTGLVSSNLVEAENKEWFKVLSSQQDLEFDRTIYGESTGSYLWFMEQLTDVLHIRQNGIHPRQSLETPLPTLELDVGEGHAIQTYTRPNGSKGYWVYIYPNFAVEFEKGKLLLTRLIPNNEDEEFGFKWELQLYYSPNVDSVEREEWEKQIEVYMEDIEAVENIKRPYFPLKKMVNDLERLSYHWGEWYLKNLKKENNHGKI